jgi:hypothetical protein
MSNPQHNFRVLTPVGWFTCDTQERLEEEISHCTEEPRAEFYQPGIGWVRYTPEPKPKPLSQQLRSLALEMERLAGEVRNLNDSQAGNHSIAVLFHAASIAKQLANWIKEKHE